MKILTYKYCKFRFAVHVFQGENLLTAALKPNAKDVQDSDMNLSKKVLNQKYRNVEPNSAKISSTRVCRRSYIIV